ncbi:MAG: hypothetical protein ACLPVO_00855 [Desulfomonilaceae bacterium]
MPASILKNKNEYICPFAFLILPVSVPIHRELFPVFERIGKIRSLNDDKLFQVKSQSLQKPWQRALKQLTWEKTK